MLKTPPHPRSGADAIEFDLLDWIHAVCTHPEHQRKGLARAAMAEGLRRLEALGARITYVGAAGKKPAANAAYVQMGFVEAYRADLWVKEW